jgi:hypothetical protein
MSRANSMRMSGVGSDAKRQSLGIQFIDVVDGGSGGSPVTPTTAFMASSSSPLASPRTLTFAPQPLPSTSTSTSIDPTPPATKETSSPSIVPEPIILPTPILTPTATTTLFSTASSPPPSQPQHSSTPPPSIYIKVRDFGFDSTDERHLGLGTDVPKPNRVYRLNRKLGGPDRAKARALAEVNAAFGSGSAGGSTITSSSSRRTDSIGSMGSVDSSDADVDEDKDGEDEGWGIGISGWGRGKGSGGGGGCNGFKLGMGRFSWSIGSSSSNIRTSDNEERKRRTSSTTTTTKNNDFPSRKDLDMNIMDSSSSSSEEDERMSGGVVEVFDNDNADEGHGEDEEYADIEEGEEEEEEIEPLYPGLYRALYAFEPEGSAEMKLEEDQIVRVVGRGGGVGWAIVVDERSSSGIVDGNGDRGGGGVSLVPEGYLEVVRLDWEDGEDELEDGDGEGDGVNA